jgi:regulator of protease activity HflC (stomatin/prohibitin superfamily)
MFLFVLALILAPVAVAGAVLWVRGGRALKKAKADNGAGSYRRDEAQPEAQTMRATGAGITVAGVLLALVFGFFSSFTAVDANTVGIVTAWGKPVGTVHPGGHLLAPWDKVDAYSTHVQVTDRKSGSEGDKVTPDCVQVNLKGAAGACADMTIRYVINADDAVDLWKRYGDFGTVRDKLLRSATDNAAKVVYGQYEPQAAISGDAIPGIAAKMTKELGNQLADSGLTLLAVAPGQVHLARDVQERLNGILNAQSDTAIAEQTKARNIAQAQANAALTNSLTTEILTQQCIEAAKVIKPAVFNCFPGGGTGQSVIVQPK